MGNTFLDLSQEDKEKFYEEKYNYYRKFTIVITIAAMSASMVYFLADCLIFGSFTVTTIIPRCSIILALIPYILYTRTYYNYKAEMIFSHVCGHCILWCSIWANSKLSTGEYVGDSFLIVHLIVMLIGFASSFDIAVKSQFTLILSLLLSHQFLRYEDVSVMLSMGIPITLGACFANFVLTHSYYETYKTNTRLENLSYIDQLTGVYNRHKLEDLTIGNKLSSVRIQDVTMLLLDIDKFKSINDTYGHDMGDIVLKDIADVLRTTLRNDDIIIRWGGEEFLVILYNCEEHFALKVAEKIRKNIADHNNGITRVTVSIGVCAYDGNNYKDTVNKADKALYEAKNTGRNKVVCYCEQ